MFYTYEWEIFHKVLRSAHFRFARLSYMVRKLILLESLLALLTPAERPLWPSMLTLARHGKSRINNAPPTSDIYKYAAACRNSRLFQNGPGRHRHLCVTCINLLNGR